MIRIFIVIGFSVITLLLYLLALQIGYLFGKKKVKEEIEDKYWNQNMLIAQYSDNYQEKIIANIKLDSSEIAPAIYEKITGKKVDDFSDIGDPYEDAWKE